MGFELGHTRVYLAVAWVIAFAYCLSVVFRRCSFRLTALFSLTFSHDAETSDGNPTSINTKECDKRGCFEDSYFCGECLQWHEPKTLKETTCKGDLSYSPTTYRFKRNDLTDDKYQHIDCSRNNFSIEDQSPIFPVHRTHEEPSIGHISKGLDLGDRERNPYALVLSSTASCIAGHNQPHDGDDDEYSRPPLPERPSKPSSSLDASSTCSTEILHFREKFNPTKYAAWLRQLSTAQLQSEELRCAKEHLSAETAIVANAGAACVSAPATGFVSVGFHAASVSYKHGKCIYYREHQRLCDEELARRGAERLRMTDREKVKMVGKGVLRCVAPKAVRKLL